MFLTLVRFPVHAGGNREERSARRPRQPPEERFQRVVLEEQAFRSHRASYLLLAHQLLAPAAQLRGVHGHLGSRGRGVHIDLSIARRGRYEFALGIPRHTLNVVLVSLEADQASCGGLAPHDGGVIDGPGDERGAAGGPREVLDVVGVSAECVCGFP